MTEQRHWAFTLAVAAVLLLFTALGNGVLTIGASVALLVVAFLLFPTERTRGALATLVAICVAAVLSATLR